MVVVIVFAAMLIAIPATAAHAVNASAPSISGTVTLGTTAIAAGTGAVSVSLYGESAGSPTGTLLSTVLTDAIGHYSFPALQNGLYALQFHATTGSYADQWWPANESENVASRITVADNPVTANANILLAGSLSGTVKNAEGVPVQGVVVYASPQGQSAGDPQMTVQYPSVFRTTDASGHYLFPQLTPGVYSVRFDTTQIPDANVMSGIWSVDGSFAWLPSQITVQTNLAHSGVDMTLPHGAQAYGYVDCSTCAGGALPSNEMTASYQILTSAPGQPQTWQPYDELPVPDAGRIFGYSMWPGTYRIQLREIGSGHFNETTSAPFVLTGGAATTVHVSTSPVDPTTVPWAGMLVKSADAPTLYFDNGPNKLLPVPSFSILADLGIPPVYTVVADSVIRASTIGAPLSDFLDCTSASFVGANGILRYVDPALLANLPLTLMDPTACGALPKSTSAEVYGQLFLTAINGNPVFAIISGTKRPIASSTALYNPTAAMVSLAYPSSPVALTVSSATLDSLPMGTPVFGAGILVKSSTSPTVYLSDGLSGLIPISSFSTVADFGLSLSYITVAPSVIASMTIAAAPLTNTVVCRGQTAIGGSGAIWNIQPALVTGLARTVLDPRTCAMIPNGSQFITNALFVKSASSPVIYHVSPAGYKEAVLDWATLVSLAGNTTPFWLTESDTFLDSLPSAPDLVTPGMLVKSASSSTVYLVDGTSRLLPIRSFESVSALGLPTSFVTVSNMLVTSRTIGGTLGSVISCGGTTYLAGDGKLWPTTTALTANYASTTLDASTCATIPHSTQNLAHALFVKSASSPTIYYLDPNGKKRALLQMASMDALSAPDAATWHTIDGSFLGSIPDGPDLVAAGMLVKSASSPTVYLVDGANRLVPIRTFESVSAMGLSTAFSTVSAATISGRTIAPTALGAFVSCGATTSVAGDGKLWPTTTALAANYPATTLDASTCATIPTSSQSLTHALFVKSASSPTIYYLDPSGKKQSLLEMASMTSLSAPDAATWLTIDSASLADIPSGSDLVTAGMVIKSASNPTLYVVDGAGGIIPVRTFDALADFGLPMNFHTVSNQTVSGLTIPHDGLGDAVLSDLATCGADTTTTWIASAGQLWQTASPIHLLAGMTALSAPLCAVLAKSPTVLNSPVIIKAPSGPTLYVLDSAGKHVIPDAASLNRVLLGNPLVYENVNSTFVAGLPYGLPEQ
jgi:hypothetical protein